MYRGPQSPKVPPKRIRKTSYQILVLKAVQKDFKMFYQLFLFLHKKKCDKNSNLPKNPLSNGVAEPSRIEPRKKFTAFQSPRVSATKFSGTDFLL